MVGAAAQCAFVFVGAGFSVADAFLIKRKAVAPRGDLCVLRPALPGLITWSRRHVDGIVGDLPVGDMQ